MPDAGSELWGTLTAFAIALAIGLLIGFERGWKQRDAEGGERVAGIRTFGLIAVLGAAAAHLSETLGAWTFPAGLVGLGILFAVAFRERAEEQDNLGATTFVAGLLTYVLGGVAVAGQPLIAASAAVVAALLLGAKLELHGFVARIRRDELFATLRLLLVSVVILPVLPDRGYGPWEAVNPFRIWLLVVFIMAISYAGYFAVRMVGAKRGLLLTGLFGGLASSTAVALNFGRYAADRPELRKVLAAGAVGASAIMFPRLAVVVAIASPALARAVLLPLAVAGAAALGLAALMAWRAPGAPDEAGSESFLPENPVNLWSALQFGALLGALMVAARALKEWFGDAGLFALAGASGLADVDAVSLSIGAMLEGGDIVSAVAAAGVLIAATSNTLVKPALVAVTSDFGMAWRVALPLAVALAAAGAAIAAQSLL